MRTGTQSCSRAMLKLLGSSSLSNRIIAVAAGQSSFVASNQGSQPQHGPGWTPLVKHLQIPDDWDCRRSKMRSNALTRSSMLLKKLAQGEEGKARPNIKT